MRASAARVPQAGAKEPRATGVARWRTWILEVGRSPPSAPRAAQIAGRAARLPDTPGTCPPTCPRPTPPGGRRGGRRLGANAAVELRSGLEERRPPGGTFRRRPPPPRKRSQHPVDLDVRPAAGDRVEEGEPLRARAEQRRKLAVRGSQQHDLEPEELARRGDVDEQRQNDPRPSENQQRDRFEQRPRQTDRVGVDANPSEELESPGWRKDRPRRPGGRRARDIDSKAPQIQPPPAPPTAPPRRNSWRGMVLRRKALLDRSWPPPLMTRQLLSEQHPTAL